MENMLPRILGVLLCALVVSAQVTPVADFDLAKIAGKWYLVGIATNSAWFVSHKDGMKMSTSVMTATENGDLDMSYANLNADGTCWRMNHVAKKTDTPGRFTFYSETWKNDNDMSFIDVVYDNYAIVHNTKTKDGVSEVLIKIYSRTAAASDDLQQKFRQASLDAGVLAENTVLLPANAECPEV
ncbi:hypothetical protein WMY93_030757 [Mugilogobius chulae]|uniref:Lipocalin/cytosolic fatty-acid binding domain-containing protein n=1 Tax=Mugilogobius chulae TaxID=88201 RepID=A0AAW0MJH4_9GOBI